MDNHTENFQEKSSKELKKLVDYYQQKHKEAREAYRSDSVKKWDEKMKEYTKKIRDIDKILLERGEL